jgi:bacteriocin biosynthesis cyclodehydratase domain-containing protein
MNVRSRLLRLSLPFTILTAPGIVRLVAGEDSRYTLTAAELDTWFPKFLQSFDGSNSVEQAVQKLPEVYQKSAFQLVERLFSERVLIDGSAIDAHSPQRYRMEVKGSASWSKGHFEVAQELGNDLPILCQDSLDYEALIRFNRYYRDQNQAWLWATTGPMNRAYVSPLFLPHAGPCAVCLLSHFRRLSPIPELYEELVEHSRKGREIVPVPFPSEGEAMLRELIRWKVALASQEQAPASLYRLHVLDAYTLEVSSHRVPINPECRECRLIP